MDSCCLILSFPVVLLFTPPLAGNGYHGEQQSLRLRRASSRVSNQNLPQFDWMSTSAERDDEDDGGQPRDLRGIPLPMALKRAVRYYNVLGRVYENTHL